MELREGLGRSWGLEPLACCDVKIQYSQRSVQTCFDSSLTSLLPQDAGGLLLEFLLLMEEEPLTVASPSAQCKMASVVLSQFFRLMAVRSQGLSNGGSHVCDGTGK